MTGRLRLPNRRRCESRDFEHAGHAFTLSTGYFADGRLAEIFLNARHIGSPIDAIARDAAIVTSLALQFGADLETIRGALTKDDDSGPSTLLGKALDVLSEGQP